MGNKKNRAKKNKRQANNWKNIIKMRKPKKTISNTLGVERNNAHDNLNFEVNYSSDNDRSIGIQTEVNDEASTDMHFDKLMEVECNGTDETTRTDELMEVEYDGTNEAAGTEFVDQIQEDLSFTNLNFDDLIFVDYDGANETSDTESTHQIEIEDTYYLEDNLALESQCENGQEISNKNESIRANLYGKRESNYIHNQEMQDESGNIDQENESIPVNLHDEPGSHDYTDIHHQEMRNESENLNQENPTLLSGRRIVDIAFLLEQMKHLIRHSEGCCDSQMVFRKETKLGFRSIFHFECSECGVFHKVQTCSKNDVNMNVNKAGVLGITSIGSGFYHLEELCAHLDIPCMSSTTFDTENKKLQLDWWELAVDNVELALKEEIEYAIATGNVDSAGNALIAIVCDGSWGKRSYGKGFSSLSGCAAIIGVYTKKVLYFDVKNKYCNICTKSYAKFCPPNDHVCNINYVGPSSGMETEIILEGFHACERMGARFHKVISDGDSSAFKEIRESCIYQNPDLVVEKLECVNHLFKNFRKQFDKLYKATEFKPEYRKLIKAQTGDDICKGIRSAAKHWRESNVDIIEKLDNLEQDCLNAPYHYYGNHDNCNRYYCSKTTTDRSIATIALLKSSGLFHEILNYCNIYFASNVRSLLEDLTTNSAEELNNVIAKYLGGKRINYSLAGSYTGRVAAAVVQYNTKGHAGSEFHKRNNIIANNACLKMENSRIRHYAKNEAARQVKPRKKPTRDKTSTIKGYKAQGLDLSGRALEVAKSVQLDKLNTNILDRDIILRDTFGQKYSLKWFEVRRKLINCSYFGRIINSRGPKSYKTVVEEILYSDIEFGNTAPIRHQRMYEKEALKMFSLVHKKHELKKTGIFIDRELGYLAASPLRLYGNDIIVSVECPVKAFRKTLDEAMSKKLLPCFKEKDGEICVNVKSNWYMEVQGQLHITGRKFAYLVVWLGPEFIIKKVAVDHSFWKTQMKPKLQFFFNEAMLLELADPRSRRNMKLREYDPQTKTFV